MQDYQEIQTMINEEKEKGAFVFLPSPILPMSKSYYMPLSETVFLRKDEIYKAQSQYRIHYNGLLRLSGAAKMKWSVDDTCRTDGRTDKLYCSFRAVGGVVEADGNIQFHKAEKDIDIEVIEMELIDQYTNNWGKISDAKNDQWKKHGHKTIETFVPAMVRRDLIQARKNKLMNAESGAKARLIRGVLGLQGSYSNEHDLIGMPFVMIYYVKNPNHPDVKKFLMNSLASSQNMIYGTERSQGQISYYDKDINDADIIDMEDIPKDEPLDENETKESQSIYDIDDKKSFSSLTPEEQEKWLKHFAKELDYDWDTCISELNGKKVVEAPRIWRTSFFEHILKDLKGAQ